MDNIDSRYEHITHPFPPLYDADSRILILGSLPSVKSREQMFFYGHKQNRFWKVMAEVLYCKYNDIKSKNQLDSEYNGIVVPATIEEKKAMLHKYHIALWDTIYSCDIIGSSDSSIRNVVPTDLKPILEQSKITKVFCNGATSARYYKKYQEKGGTQLNFYVDVYIQTFMVSGFFSSSMVEDVSDEMKKIQENM